MSTFLTEEKAKLISKINEIKDQSVIDDLMRLLPFIFYLMNNEPMLWKHANKSEKGKA